MSMDILGDLIKIKQNVKSNDLITMLDELSIYEKLSVNEKFRDLKSSEIARSKCPMLARFVDDQPYELILGELIANVYLHIEGEIPDLLRTIVERTPKQRKQFEILQKGIAHVCYKMLTEYDHETMADYVEAVFTNRKKGSTTVAIIVKNANMYEMYHGIIVANNVSHTSITGIEPIMARGKRGIFVMNTYSMLGNNGYPFGKYSNSENSYEIMIGPDGQLFFLQDGQIAMERTIPKQKQNSLNMAKTDVNNFAKEVVSLIESEMG